VDSLLRASTDWMAARDLRTYIEAVKAKCMAQGRQLDEPQVATWVEWASCQADRLDPLRESPPSILDEDLGPDDPPNRYQRGW
jgi:hypothetical protein